MFQSEKGVIMDVRFFKNWNIAQKNNIGWYHEIHVYKKRCSFKSKKYLKKKNNFNEEGKKGQQRTNLSK